MFLTIKQHTQILFLIGTFPSGSLELSQIRALLLFDGLTPETSAFCSVRPGKTRTHCGGNIVSCDVAHPWQNVATLLRAARTQPLFAETFDVSRTQNLCPPQMLRAWQNESTFEKHDHVSNVAATIRAVYTSENKPRITQSASYVSRELLV